MSINSPCVRRGRLGECTIRLGYASFLTTIAFRRFGSAWGPTQRLRRDCLDSEYCVSTFMASHFDRHYCSKCDLAYVYQQEGWRVWVLWFQGSLDSHMARAKEMGWSSHSCQHPSIFGFHSLYLWHHLAWPPFAWQPLGHVSLSKFLLSVLKIIPQSLCANSFPIFSSSNNLHSSYAYPSLEF